MSFDAIASHYRWLEWATAGSLLQRCRTAFMDRLADARNILLLGEGRGRFLTELLKINSNAHITVLDTSEKMIELMQASLQRNHLHREGLRFLKMDVLVLNSAWPDRPDQRLERYDAVASHFFLDCFTPAQLEGITRTIAAHTTSHACWLVSDFRMPDGGWRRMRAQLILKSLYLFFRTVTQLPAQQLTAPDTSLTKAGFRLECRKHFNFGLLHSDAWRRGIETGQQTIPGRDTMRRNKS